MNVQISNLGLPGGEKMDLFLLRRPLTPSEIGLPFPDIPMDKNGYTRLYEDGEETLIWTNSDYPVNTVPQKHEIETWMTEGKWELAFFGLLQNANADLFEDEDMMPDDEHCCHCEGCDDHDD